MISMLSSTSSATCSAKSDSARTIAKASRPFSRSGRRASPGDKTLPTAAPDESARIREAITRLCAGFDDAYWLERDREGGFPEAFYRAVAEGGWLGIAMPETYGGSGLGIAEAAVMMQAVAESGA